MGKDDLERTPLSSIVPSLTSSCPVCASALTSHIAFSHISAPRSPPAHIQHCYTHACLLIAISTTCSITRDLSRQKKFTHTRTSNCMSAVKSRTTVSWFTTVLLQNWPFSLRPTLYGNHCPCFGQNNGRLGVNSLTVQSVLSRNPFR
jgi:hypothetical protein